MKLCRYNISLTVGILLSVFFVLISLLSLFWLPFDIEIIDISQRFQPASFPYLLGTDQLGRDLLSMLMAGAGPSIAVALSAVLGALVLGIPIGLLAAAQRYRVVDELLLRGSDVIFAFPGVVVAILCSATFGPSLSNAILAIGFFNLAVFIRLVRSRALILWQQDFILAARLAGKGSWRISWEHILPNIFDLLMVQAATQFALAIIAESGLSYLGLGSQPPMSSWGKMLADSQTLLTIEPRLVLAPLVIIFLTVFGFTSLGTGLQQLFERHRGS